LTRYRTSLVRERSAEVNRVQKVLESANIKLATVATDVLGASGRLMLPALAAGQEDATHLANLTKGTLRKKLALLQQALVEGRVQPHHRTLIRALLQHITFLEERITDVDHALGAALKPFQRQMLLRQSIPGISATAAAILIAAIGVDRHRFVSGRHLASWAGVCPGNRESAGKRLSSHLTQGNVWLRGLLGEVAWAAVRTKGTSLHARFQRLVRRMPPQKAVVAVMQSLLLVIHAVLAADTPYRELGPDY
jgi:transposase